MPVNLGDMTRRLLLESPLWAPLCFGCDVRKMFEAGAIDFATWDYDDHEAAWLWATTGKPEDPLPEKLEAYFGPLRRKGKA